MGHIKKAVVLFCGNAAFLIGEVDICVISRRLVFSSWPKCGKIQFSVYFHATASRKEERPDDNPTV